LYIKAGQAEARSGGRGRPREQAYQQRVAAHTAAAAAKSRRPRQLKRRPQEAPNPKAVANVTDPDSHFLHTRTGTMQGYNSQPVTTLEQLVVAAELTDEANDIHQLDPMLKATATTLAAAGIDERPEALLADSGYWSIDNLTTIPNTPELYIPPAKHGRQGRPRRDGKPSASRSDGLRAAMRAKLGSEDGKTRYAKRRETSTTSSTNQARWPWGASRAGQGATERAGRALRAGSCRPWRSLYIRYVHPQIPGLPSVDHERNPTQPPSRGNQPPLAACLG